MSDTHKHFNFILGDQFSMLCFAAVVDTLRAANMALGRDAYSWCTVSHDGHAVTASNGFTVQSNHSLDTMPKGDYTFVVVSLVVDVPGVAKIVSVLRQLGRHGGNIGALSVGAALLARAGLLDGYRCTVHWEYEASFRDMYPNCLYTGSVFEIDRTRFTSAGGTTGIDLMLEIIRQDFGDAAAIQAANNFHYEHIRSPEDRQRAGPEPDLRGKSEKLQVLVRLMGDNLEDPLSAGELASAVHLSVRQVERLFLKHLNSTPGRYYMMLRLARARQLLRQTNTPILDIALATGFASHSYFAQSYRMQYGKPPSEERHAPMMMSR